jgi:hypothetical protein
VAKNFEHGASIMGSDSLTGMEPSLSGAFFDHELANERQRRPANPIFRPDAIPPGYYTWDEWIDRGYSPREDERSSASILFYARRAPNGFMNESLYSFAQVREIRGVKAAQRRRVFHATLAAQGKPLPRIS